MNIDIHKWLTYIIHEDRCRVGGLVRCRTDSRSTPSCTGNGAVRTARRPAGRQLPGSVICVGSWTQGLFIIWQHPTKESMQFIDRLDNLAGKKAVVFCTYKLATGSLLPTLAKGLERKGASVVGQFKYRGPNPGNEFASFVESLS